MIKDAIGILDMGMETLPFVYILSKIFRRERFVYANDLKNQPYEGQSPESIMNYVKTNMERLLSQNLKLVIVGSDVIFEYTQAYLQSLSIPVINVVDTLIDYVNTNYEQKNIVLLAKNSVLEANLYQKNIKYNHLYSLPSDELESIIMNKLTKTTKAFYTAKETLAPAIKKEVDIVITSSPFLTLMKIELEEYLKLAEITDLGEIFAQKIKESGCTFYDKKRGSITILGTTSKRHFQNFFIGPVFKYKYIQSEQSCVVNNQK
jgi:glutamate racemase